VVLLLLAIVLSASRLWMRWYHWVALCILLL
jgi:hypothetical protein